MSPARLACDSFPVVYLHRSRSVESVSWSPWGRNLAGPAGAAAAAAAGTRLFVISPTAEGKHKIKRLSETLPCLFSHLVS